MIKDNQNKNSKKPRYVPSYYKLSEVYQKIDNNQVIIKGNAKQLARIDFGWDTSDILKAYKALRPPHFYKTDNSKMKFGIIIDYYKAHIYGEDIYTHFYIDDQLNKLVINSFHKQ